MPLPSRLFLTGLALLLAGVAGADDDLNWVDRDTMTSLPPVQQRPIPVWCSGIYYNPSVGVPADQSDIIITADSTSLTEDGLINMDGEVLIERPGRRLTSQSALLDQSSGKFEVANSLRLETDQFTFIADGMSGQTQRREASLNRVRYALFGPGARGTAEHIDLVDNFTTIEQGTYTTCAPGSNGWELGGRQIRLDREKGWGEARDVTLRVKGMPLLWLPWITFPIDERRKTGLLFPTISTSDSGGVDLTQPIYINIHPQMDATIAPRHIDGRGSGVEGEFRYLSDLGQGRLSYGVLFNDSEFDGENRELAAWQHDGSVGRWALTSDVNYVSDDFYFKDLDTGLEVSSRTHLPRLGQARYFGRDWRALAHTLSSGAKWLPAHRTREGNELCLRGCEARQRRGIAHVSAI